MDGTINYLKKGNTYIEKGELIKAEKVLAKGLAKGQADSMQYINQLARVNQLLGDYEQSEAYYRRAYNQNSGDSQQYAEVLTMNEKYAEAEQVLSQVESGSKVIEKRRQSFAELSLLKSDNEGYLVRLADFNSREREIFAAALDEELVISSARSQGKSMLRLKDGRDQSDFYDLYLVNGTEIDGHLELSSKLNQGAFAQIAATGELLVTENYLLSNKNVNKDEHISLKINSYKRSEEGGWKLGYTLPFCKETYSVGHPAYDAVHGILYFSSDMPGGIGESDIYKVSYSDGEWGDPVLVDHINTEGNELYPFVDELRGDLYFSSNGYGGLGGLDVYKTSLRDHRQVYNLGSPVNSSKDDFALVLDASGKSGWLASDRQGGAGMDDVYELSVFLISVSARITGVEDGASVLSGLKIIDRKSNREVPYEVLEDNLISFEGVEDKEYEIIVDVDGYEPSTRIITATDDMDGQVVELALSSGENEEDYYGITLANLSSPLTYAVGIDTLFVVNEVSEHAREEYSIQNVFFDFDSDEPNAAEEVVSKLSSIMKDHPQIRLEIVSYSDSRGSKKYNTQLAQRRADALIAKLEEKGIQANRLEVTAIGEERIYNGCKDGVDCSDEQHADNRRIEFFMKME